MSEPRKVSKAEIEAGLKVLRRRRVIFWILIAVYLPMIYVVLEMSGSDKVTGIFFGFWLFFVTIAANVVAFSKCPSCGQFFHMNGMIPMYFRNCLHCGLHITGDEKRNKFEK